MTPKQTIRSSRKAQQFHRSATSGTGELPALPAREWLSSVAGAWQKVERQDFSGEALLSAHLEKTTFSRTRFVGADLRQADLRNAFFLRCDLTDANLEGADLTAARFSHCDLTGATIDPAQAERADFEFCTGLVSR